jgi:colicin import membrane protein
MTPIRSIPQSSYTQQTHAAARTSKPVEAGLAARVSQLGPTLGTAVATAEAVGDVAEATYTAALQGWSRLGRAADDSVGAVKSALGAIGETAEDAVDAIEEAADDVGDALSGAVNTVGEVATATAEKFSSGVRALGRLVDLSA